MFRWFLTCCVIVGLLWCPLRCHGIPTGLRDSESAPAKKCCCCRHAYFPAAVPESTENDVPAHSENCGCGSCLCEGAVVRNLEEIDAPVASSDFVGCEITILVDIAARRTSLPSADPQPRVFLSGCEIAVLYGNLRR